MVTGEAETRSAVRLRQLARAYRMPILSIHAPVLVRAQLAWGVGPTTKLARAAELARAVSAPTVVAHPAFSWQRAYARDFEAIVARTASYFDVEIAVENMFPYTIAGFDVASFVPSYDPVSIDCDAVTLDFSHAALAGRDSLELAMALGERLHHIHLADGTSSHNEGRMLDEHLVPGRGSQPVADVLRYLARTGWSGSVVAEVTTRAARSEPERIALLAETLAFAREHSVVPSRGKRGIHT
jgi:sugar phosphate isomerase/epimerase